jgi:hypothetical protein
VGSFVRDQLRARPRIEVLDVELSTVPRSGTRARAREFSAHALAHRGAGARRPPPGRALRLRCTPA